MGESMKGIILAGGNRFTALADYPGEFQAAHSDLRQTDGVLPAVYIDDRWYP